MTWTYSPTTMQLSVPSASALDSPVNKLVQFELFYTATTAGLTTYMGTYCRGVATGTCITGFPTCTQFKSSSAQGVSCRLVASMNPDAADAAYQTVCGIDPTTQGFIQSPPQAGDVEALKTPDCACINYEQSTFKQATVMNLDFAGFRAWMIKNKIPQNQPRGYCWWPSCQGEGGNSLHSKTLEAGLQPCPSTTECIATINAAEVTDNSDLTTQISQKCGGVGPGSDPGDGTNGDGTTEDPKDDTTKKSITEETWFLPVAISLGILVLLIFAYFMTRKHANGSN